MEFQDLPLEVKFEVGRWLGPADLARLQSTSRSNNETYGDDFVWKRAYERDYPLAAKHGRTVGIVRSVGEFGDTYRKLWIDRFRNTLITRDNALALLEQLRRDALDDPVLKDAVTDLSFSYDGVSEFFDELAHNLYVSRDGDSLVFDDRNTFSADLTTLIFVFYGRFVDTTTDTFRIFLSGSTRSARGVARRFVERMPSLKLVSWLRGEPTDPSKPVYDVENPIVRKYYASRGLSMTDRISIDPKARYKPREPDPNCRETVNSLAFVHRSGAKEFFHDPFSLHRNHLADILRKDARHKKKYGRPKW